MLRDQLMSELNGIKSAEDAAIWARRILPAKNALNSAMRGRLKMPFRLGWRLWKTQPTGPMDTRLQSCLNRQKDQSAGPGPQASTSPICPIRSRAAFATGIM